MRTAHFASNPAPSHQKIEIVETLRGLAALSVAWFHFTNANKDFLPDGYLKTSGFYGWLGVEVFFVISGFVIPFAMHRANYILASLPTFLGKRLLRLEPPYIVSIVITLGLWWISSLSPGFSREAPSVPQVLLHLGYLNAFFGYAWINTAYWTLAIEFQYYLLMAFAFPLLGHRRAQQRLLGIVCLCALPYVFASERLVFHYLGLFALGVATFQWQRAMLSKTRYLVLIAAITGTNLATLGPVVSGVGATTALLIAFIRHAPWRPLTVLGTLSYSLYLVHAPLGERVVNLGARFAESLISQIAVLLAAVGVSLVAAYLLYRFVERPSLRLSASLRYKTVPEGAEPKTGLL